MSRMFSHVLQCPSVHVSYVRWFKPTQTMNAYLHLQTCRERYQTLIRVYLQRGSFCQRGREEKGQQPQQSAARLQAWSHVASLEMSLRLNSKPCRNPSGVTTSSGRSFVCYLQLKAYVGFRLTCTRVDSAPCVCVHKTFVRLHFNILVGIFFWLILNYRSIIDLPHSQKVPGWNKPG